MHSTRYQTDEQIARENRRLKDELETQRYERERDQEQRERDQERQKRERRELLQEQMRSASDWPTAFTKNHYLMMRERNECFAPADEDPQYIESMNDLRAGWDRSLDEICRAAAIWAEEQKAVDEAIQQMRVKVAQRLRTDNPNSELADYIEQDAIDEWMNW